MRVLKTKRGVEAIGMLITVAIGLLLLFVFVFGVIPKISSSIFGASSCEKNVGYQCVESSLGCPSNFYRDLAYDQSCKEGMICCAPEGPVQANELVARFSSNQRKALLDAILVTVDNNPKKVTEMSFKANEPEHKIKISFNDQLPADSFGPVAVYFSNSKESGKIYLLSGSSGNLFEVTPSVPKPYDDMINNDLRSEPYNTNSKSFKSLVLGYKPALKDSYQNYNLNVVVLDIAKITCQKKFGTQDQQKWINCLTNATLRGPSTQVSGEEEIKKYVSDANYYLARKTINLKVERILDITGIGTNWMAEDAFTIVSKDPAYNSKVGIALIDAGSQNAVGFDKVVALCEEAAKNPDSFKYELENIVGTTLETSGIPLNINIGGFRIPTSTTQLRYILQKNKIIMTKGVANVKIDKASIQNFLEKPAGNFDANSLLSQEVYVCAKAAKMSGDNVAATAVAVSPSPLKIDVIPPVVDQELDVRVVLPPVNFNTPGSSYNSQYPSIAGQPYFYMDYPKIIITCVDKQSGCSNYDYYIKTGNYIDLSINTNDVSDAVIGVALGLAANALLNKLAMQNPEATICPYLFSNEYRVNSQPVIRFRYPSRGLKIVQGIACIRVKDKAGNAVLVWKELVSTEEMITRVALEAAQKAEQEAEKAVQGAVTT